MLLDSRHALFLLRTGKWGAIYFSIFSSIFFFYSFLKPYFMGCAVGFVYLVFHLKICIEFYLFMAGISEVNAGK